MEQSIRDYVLPGIGKRRLEELCRADLVDVVRRVSAAGKVETAHRLGYKNKMTGHGFRAVASSVL